jgi:hypothetical protein
VACACVAPILRREFNLLCAGSWQLLRRCTCCLSSHIAIPARALTSAQQVACCVSAVAFCLVVAVTAEIGERTAFLEQMRALGQARQYENVIAREIQEVCAWLLVALARSSWVAVRLVRFLSSRRPVCTLLQGLRLPPAGSCCCLLLRSLVLRALASCSSQESHVPVFWFSLCAAAGGAQEVRGCRLREVVAKRDRFVTS